MTNIKDPNLLNMIEYQKEALLILVASAREAQQAWGNYSDQPNNRDLEQKYQSTRNHYTLDVETLQQAHEVFKDLKIHWSNLPQFIRKWQIKNSATWDRKTIVQINSLEVAELEK